MPKISIETGKLIIDLQLGIDFIVDEKPVMIIATKSMAVLGMAVGKTEQGLTLIPSVQKFQINSIKDTNIWDPSSVELV